MQTYSELILKINKLSYQAIREGYQPTHIWLGPHEVRIVEEEINQKIKDKLSFSSRQIAEAAITGDISGMEIYGLTVCLAAKDGVVVSANWS